MSTVWKHFDAEQRLRAMPKVAALAIAIFVGR